jgi:glycosyltransferase involved in cell wall biosynthesis
MQHLQDHPPRQSTCTMTTHCKICNAESHPFGNAQMLNKYDVAYFRCSECGFVQTEQPYWLDEAYSSAIANLDVGIVTRNLGLHDHVQSVISHYFNPDAAYLDYGGGCGLFVRLMRDAGFDFYWYDKFCENVLAQGFAGELQAKKYELVTAFELFEHLVDPLSEIKQLIELGGSLLFSTELLPDNAPKPNEWWYYVPATGQHISIYTLAALERFAEQLGCNLYSDGRSLHLFSRREFPKDILLTTHQPLTRRPSLITQDFQRVSNLSNQIDSIDDPDEIAGEMVAEEIPKDIQKSKIVIDGVFFQLYRTGIARVWNSLLEQWANDDFRANIIILDREQTAPRIAGIDYRLIPKFSYEAIEADQAMLQEICDAENADLFISTYYTTPITTPSIFMGYDMIPEVLGADLTNPMWQSKHHAIKHAIGYITISEHTAHDLKRFFPELDAQRVIPALCGVAEYFYPPSQYELLRFRDRYNLQKPYFIVSGPSFGYKNMGLFLEGLAQLHSRYGFEVVCTGSSGLEFSSQARKVLPDVVFHSLFLEDDELRCAYGGAIALVYPSKYEGFGLPVVEAMKCGCPVITCANASIPEVGGNAVMYIPDDDTTLMANALLEVQKPNVRQAMIAQGCEQAKQFNWATMAEQVKAVLLEYSAPHYGKSQSNLQCIWVNIDWAEGEEAVQHHFIHLFQALLSSPEAEQYELLIDATTVESSTADEYVMGALMQLLMSDFEALTEPALNFVTSVKDKQAILHNDAISKIDLANRQTYQDIFTATNYPNDSILGLDLATAN